MEFISEKDLQYSSVQLVKIYLSSATFDEIEKEMKVELLQRKLFLNMDCQFCKFSNRSLERAHSSTCCRAGYLKKQKKAS